MPVDKRILMAASGVVLGLGLLGGAYALHRKTPRPPASWPAPPTSASVGPALEDLGSKHPNLKKLAEDPKVGSVIKEFAEAYSTGGVPRAKEFARERGFMNGDDDITLTVLTENDETAELEASIKELKAVVVGRGDSQIDVQIPWSVVEDEAKSGRPPEELLEKVANLKNVRGILPMERPEKNQLPFGGRPVDGVRATRADKWHTAGFKGAGVKVGILDPEVSKSSRYLGTALPKNTPVFLGGCVNNRGQSVDDEGLHGPAAAEIVHAMAPEAQLYIACSLGDDDAAIQWLVQQGVRVISYSAGGIYGRRNGTGRSQDRINRLARQGILWVNAAGNDGRTFHRGQLSGGSGWHAFAPGKNAMGFKTKSVAGSVKLTLIWSQWDTALISDYDLYIFDASMNELAKSANRNTTLRQPSETISARLKPGTQYFVGIRANPGARAASFILNIHNAGSVEYLVPSGSLGQPADAVGALSVGAVSWNTSKLAPYSSRGPTEDGRLKPEISAPTEVSSVVYKGNFAGTSAAAPHVSGAAALVWGRNPQFTRDQVVNFLLGRARDMGPQGPDNDFGHGCLDMGDPGGAVAIAPPTPVAPPKVAPPSTAPTPSPTPTPGDEDDDDGSALRTVFAILFLIALGALAVVSGLIALAVHLIRGAKRPNPRAQAPFIPTPAPTPAAPPFHPGAHHQGPPFHGGPPHQGPPFQGGTPHPTPFQNPQAGIQVGHPGHHAPLQGGHPGQPQGGPQGGYPSGGTMGPQGFPPGGTVIPTGRGWSGVLVFVSGPGAGAQFPLGPGIFSIGRSPGNQLVVADALVSSRHAVIRTDEQGCWVEDLGSRNGLYVNGQRVQRHFLQPGDTVTIGPAHLRFEVLGA
jgi:subtilisin family serine protease